MMHDVGTALRLILFAYYTVDAYIVTIFFLLSCTHVSVPACTFSLLSLQSAKCREIQTYDICELNDMYLHHTNDLVDCKFQWFTNLKV